MIMADVFKIVFILVGFLTAFIAYWLLGAGLFPDATQRSAELYGKHPVKATLFGLLLYGPVFAIGMLLANAPQPALKFVGVALMLVQLMVGLFGSAGLVLRIGSGLRSSRDEIDPWRRVLRGSVVLALAFVMPLLGWFVLLPWTVVSGFGALWLSRPRAVRAPAPLPVPTAADQPDAAAPVAQ
jgi:hypothetical protein